MDELCTKVKHSKGRWLIFRLMWQNQKTVRKYEQSVGILQFRYNQLWDYSGSTWADPEQTIFFRYSLIMRNNIRLLSVVLPHIAFEIRAKPFSCSLFVLYFLSCPCVSFGCTAIALFFFTFTLLTFYLLQWSLCYTEAKAVDQWIVFRLFLLWSFSFFWDSFQFCIQL